MTSVRPIKRNMNGLYKPGAGLMNKRRPFVMIPASKDYLWGGSRLNDDFNLRLDANPLAEAWLCSTHADGQSCVDGIPLGAYLKKHPDFLGIQPIQTMQGKPELPILIKLIDARNDLSIQVHPNDEYAAVHENGSLGKTEMWYVLDARPGARLIYGFRDDMTADEVRKSIYNGTITSHLNQVLVKKNDIFLVEPGTVHAIGAGCLIAEIQENSNITYRLYDYDRVDKSGAMRPLHIEKALAVMNMKCSASPRQPLRVLRYKPGFASELLIRCKYFHVERLLLNTEVQRDLVNYQTGETSFHALICIDGCGTISCEGEALNFFKGDCIFVPAGSELLKLHGRAQILDVSC